MKKKRKKKVRKPKCNVCNGLHGSDKICSNINKCQYYRTIQQLGLIDYNTPNNKSDE